MTHNLGFIEIVDRIVNNKMTIWSFTTLLTDNFTTAIKILSKDYHENKRVTLKSCNK